MFEHPWFLLLLILLCFFAVFRKPKYFLRHVYVAMLEKRAKSFNPLPWFRWVGWILLVVAAAGLTKGHTIKTKKTLAHKYILINDGSGSMTDQKIKLDSVLNGCRKFLSLIAERKNEDFVGFVVFSDDAFVVSYPVTDPQFVQQKIDNIRWDVPPLGKGTEIQIAIWTSLRMILKQNTITEGTFFHDTEIAELEKILENDGNIELQRLTEKIDKTKDEIKGTAFIIFTDGRFVRSRLSTKKLFQLCEKLGIKVYMVSVEIISPNVELLIKITGGKGIVTRGFNENILEKIYTDIFEQEAGDYLIIDKIKKKSCADLLGSVSLLFVFLTLCLEHSFFRNLTRI